MKLAPRVCAIAALGGLSACCRPSPAPEPPAGPRPLYSVGTVSRLVDGRLGPNGALLVAELDDGSRQVLAVDARGEDVWHSDPIAHVLLGPTPDAPIYTVNRGSRTRQVSVLAAATGKVERTFTVARPSKDQDRWERDGDDLWLIEAAIERAPSTVVSIDGRSGQERWARDIGVSIPHDLGWVFHSPVLPVGGSIHVFCRPPGSQDHSPDLCRLSRADGSLVATVKGPVNDMAAAGDAVFVLRSDAVEALGVDGAARWRRPLAPGHHGSSLVARNGWLVALTSLVKNRNEHQEQLLALDAADGHPLWTKDTSPGGEHYQNSLAMSDERVFYVSNLDPNMRVVDRTGALVLGATWKTELVVSTEVVGGFVEGLRGPPLFQGALLALPRDKQGVEVYRVP